jgi:hypothetical protein
MQNSRLKIVNSSFEDLVASSIPLPLRKLAAAGLSRIWQQMLNGGPWGMVSAYHELNNLTPEGKKTNKTLDESLRDLLRHFGVGFVVMPQSMFVNEQIGKLLPDPSVFIANVREDDVKAIAELFGQQAYVFGENGQFAIRQTDGTPIMQGAVKDYLRQLSKEEAAALQQNSENSSLPGFSGLKGRYWAFDKDRAQNIQKAKEEIERVQKQFPRDDITDIVSYVLSEGRTARIKKVAEGMYLSGKKVGYCYYHFEKPIKFVSHFDCIQLDDVTDVPPGSSLSIFLPLRETGH